MIASPFAQTAPGLIQSGYSPLPLMPGEKKPGTYDSRDGWHLMKNWQKYCGYVPFPNVVAMWATWPNAGVGVALGRGLICIDIDQENLIDPLLAILPPCFVQKKGRKGISLFYRGNTEVIRSKNYRTPEKVGLVDLLAEGKQTVLPPSIHPDTGEPYYWWSDLALQDVSLDELEELPNDIGERIGEVLKSFGYDPDRDRMNVPAVADCVARRPDADSIFRRINNLALASFDLWVPALGLRRRYRSGSGYTAVAEWRASSSGRPFERRKPNLSFSAHGIRDFGDGRGYSPIDVVMAALRLSLDDALNWLGERVDPNWNEPLIILNASRKPQA